jgi:drug/metabolite transporter (DMT)-like permease
MWTLFTKALARGTSTTQVSIINTSSNFMITAILGFFIFAESLPPLWWLGASLLVAGNVIIGRREEKDVDPDMDPHVAAENGQGMPSEGTCSEGNSLLGDSIELIDETEVALKKQDGEEEDDMLDLGDLETEDGVGR